MCAANEIWIERGIQSPPIDGVDGTGKTQNWDFHFLMQLKRLQLKVLWESSVQNFTFKS